MGGPERARDGRVDQCRQDGRHLGADAAVGALRAGPARPLAGVVGSQDQRCVAAERAGVAGHAAGRLGRGHRQGRAGVHHAVLGAATGAVAGRDHRHAVDHAAGRRSAAAGAGTAGRAGHGSG